METFLYAYLLIAFILFMLLTTLMHIVGIDNLKNAMNVEDFEDIDFDSPMLYVGFAFACLIWPYSIIFFVQNKDR